MNILFRKGQLALLCLSGAFPFAHAADGIQGTSRNAILVPEQEVGTSTPVTGDALEARFPIRVFAIDGNTLLATSELSPLLVQFIGEDRSFVHLRQAAAVLQKAYRNAGYGGVIAYVPEQTLSDGRVLLRVVEGKLGQVIISGNSRLDNANIRYGLPALREGETPQVRRIDQNIQLSNESPAKELRVMLSRGAQAGELDARVEVAEQEPIRVLLGFDNTGNDPTGDYRASIGFQHANLFNRDHTATLQYQTSPTKPEQVSIVSVGYRIPLYEWNSNIDAYYAHSNVNNGTTSTPAGALRFTGKGDITGFGITHYLERSGDYEHNLNLGLEERHYGNQCAIGELGPGGCGSAGVSIWIRPLRVGYTGQKETRRWGFNLGLVGNFGGSDAETFSAARHGANRNYHMWRGNVFGELFLDRGISLIGRANAQHSAQPLIVGEQFGIGGATSVRGYHEREIAGDSGVVVNLEAMGADLAHQWSLEPLNLRPLLFGDYGQVSNRDNTPCHNTQTTCQLSSIGMGMRFAYGKAFSGRLDLAHRLQPGAIQPADQNRLHVALYYTW